MSCRECSWIQQVADWMGPGRPGYRLGLQCTHRKASASLAASSRACPQGLAALPWQPRLPRASHPLQQPTCAPWASQPYALSAHTTSSLQASHSRPLQNGCDSLVPAWIRMLSMHEAWSTESVPGSQGASRRSTPIFCSILPFEITDAASCGHGCHPSVAEKEHRLIVSSKCREPSRPGQVEPLIHSMSS